MIIEKNMNIKLDIDSQIVAEYLKGCKGNRDEISKLVDCMDIEMLALITSKYLGEMYSKSPYMLKKYIEPFYKLFNKENENDKPDYNNLKVGTELYWNYGESDFVKSMCIFPNKETYDKLRVRCKIVDSTKDTYVFQVMNAPKNWLFGIMKFTVSKAEFVKEIGNMFTLI